MESHLIEKFWEQGHQRAKTD